MVCWVKTAKYMSRFSKMALVKEILPTNTSNTRLLKSREKKNISQKHEYSGPTPICYVAFPVLTIKTAVQMRIMAGDARGS